MLFKMNAFSMARNLSGRAPGQSDSNNSNNNQKQKQNVPIRLNFFKCFLCFVFSLLF